MMFYQKNEVYEMIQEIRDCIVSSVNYCGLSHEEKLDTEDAVNTAISLLEKVENYIDIVPLP